MKKYRIKFRSYPETDRPFYVERRTVNNSWEMINYWSLEEGGVNISFFKHFHNAYRFAEEVFSGKIYKKYYEIRNQGYLKGFILFQKDEVIIVEELFQIYNIWTSSYKYWTKKIKKTFTSLDEVEEWIRINYSPDKISY